MADDSVRTTTVINAPAKAIFAVLADPAKHAAIDGTSWVREALDSKPLTATGQIFRMSMYHPNHPEGTYQMANRVPVFDPPSTISWEPGNEAGDGTLSFPGWTWRYDLTPAGPSNTTVTLSYEWSAVPEIHPTAHRIPAVPSDPGFDPPKETRSSVPKRQSGRWTVRHECGLSPPVVEQTARLRDHWARLRIR